MIEEKTWKEFQDNGLLWFVNRILHIFGWAIVVELDDDNNIVRTFPVRTKFRGFSEDVETKGFKRLTKYIKENIEDLEKETFMNN